ncbi:hypothetical protein CsatB_007000 [Cannabis sativa]|uniref:DUF4283 domain-containing protein n=1 Tax=Cannabis sativa TaxID=3483 RepID=A0A803NFN1_CANSA|nr:uncharacterized protein LOC115709648 [Cannabis sativa]
MEPLIHEGQKIAKVDVEEVKMQAGNWSTVVICMVLGANPPFAVFEGFIRRMWGKLGIVQVVRVNAGFTIVKFNDEATRDLILKEGMIQFDRKSVIIRPRMFVEMDITDDPPKTIEFLSEHGRLIEQDVEYEWLSTKCKKCGGYGHGMMDYRKGEKTQFVKKAGVGKEKIELKTPTNEKQEQEAAPINEKEPHDKEKQEREETIKEKGKKTVEW